MPDSLPQRIERVMVAAQLIPANMELPLAPTTKLAEDLGMDSIDAMDFMFGLQEEFDITITDDEQQGLETLADVRRFVEGKIGLAR